ncbi:hypothetical protein PPYR_14197 [Photinus pyralis]|uniref:Alpha-mannosidase n=1 Tax=Photinus pyralis TaxID=7054 RepID=A0A5N4A4L7_PHOPY|nr:lysosomal alpha-mannosidase-like [Photinus pyralis]KAB0792238.1 hypothetical protein PPYR_14197 [Photinus pyralis]
MKYVCLVLWFLPILGLSQQHCGYNACPRLNASELNVHIIAHSHDDVGWLKTVDEYYYGTRSHVQSAQVKYIISSVVDALRENPKRRFIQVETAFFHKWWQEQNEEKRQQVHDLIRNGRLQIVGGGWSMNDEGAVHYQPTIDQFTFALKFLKDTFGECALPKVAWQIDPFGHTREMASMFAQMGFDGFFMGRIDWRDRYARFGTRTAEMLWQGSANLGNESKIFTHLLYEHYTAPSGFYFDVNSKDDPLVANSASPAYNLKKKVAEFTNYVDRQSGKYTSNNIMITMGHDFAYQNANYNFDNLDTLIKAYEDWVQVDSKNRRIRLIYSTPTCYLKAVNDYANSHGLAYKIKTDDFVPLWNDAHTYWSGYYTSRPTQKRFERQGNNLLQIAKQLTARRSDLNQRVDELRDAMGVMQHHDAITGTEKDLVAKDYARIVMKAFDSTFDVISSALNQLLGGNQVVFRPCLMANVSQCEETRREKFVVAVYNPLSRRVSHHVRLPIDSEFVAVTDLDGNAVQWQITPRIDAFANIPNVHIAKYDLVFLAENLPPLGAKLFHVVTKSGQNAPITPVPADQAYELGDSIHGVKLDKTTGLLQNVTLHDKTLGVKQELMFYFSAQGNNQGAENRASGAYIFRPDASQPTALPLENAVNVTTFKGPLLDEVHQHFGNWAKQIIRVYKGARDHIEFDWLVGPIDVSDGKGKEVISRFQLQSFGSKENVFYTDSNGRELIRRKKNYRETFEYTDEEKVAGNYFPVTSSLSLVDDVTKMEAAVLTDRAQGGGSLEAGQLELMIHRRLLRDDAFGVEQALNEEEFGNGLRVRGQHFFTFGATSRVRRDIAQQKILASWAFVADGSSGLPKIQSEFSLLTRELPAQVQLLTLEHWSENEVLLRFEHILEASEGGCEQTVNFQNLFTFFDVTDLQETTLAASMKLEERKQMHWSNSGCLSWGETTCERSTDRVERKLDVDIKLAPMQIRTFIATVEGKRIKTY